MLKRINVVAGIIWNKPRDQILLGFRRPDQHQGGLWEFPGGKVEEGEDQLSALSRELEEEIGIVVTDAQAFQQVSHDYDDKSVFLDFWHVTDYSGEPIARESQTLEWVYCHELADYEFPAANQTIARALLAGFS